MSIALFLGFAALCIYITGGIVFAFFTFVGYFGHEDLLEKAVVAFLGLFVWPLFLLL